MPLSDFFIVFQWWSTLFLIGAAAFPLTKHFFPSWFDKGYFFSKAIGFAVVSYLVYVAGTIHLAPFSVLTIIGALIVVFGGGIVLQKKNRTVSLGKMKAVYAKYALLFGVEEVLFFFLLLLWSVVKAHEPSIRGLEKFMDYGFMQSIVNTRYFPAADMWWAGGSINYYYFGHLVTALVTKLSGLSLGYTFNLMLATIFSLTATMSFSLGYQMLCIEQKKPIAKAIGIGGGILTAFLVTLAGNMQTIYAFTKGYVGDEVKPFWQLFWTAPEFFHRLGDGMATYWYANATRFIPFSIHEFPSYSFVVSDVHGHVLSIPFVLLAIAMLIQFFSRPLTKKHIPWGSLVAYGFLLGVCLMTNALDGPIYGGIFAICYLVFGILPDKKIWKSHWWEAFYPIGLVALIAFATALPFLFFFDSFATGIGVNCPPAFLAGSKIGMFLFEAGDKCQKSPLWMMWLLWGFFWFTGAWLFVKKIWHGEDTNKIVPRILKVFFLFSVGLIIFPEFFYVKDIYPMHFRSNTMFKLGYQAFILWSLIAGYVITRMAIVKNHRLIRGIFFLLLLPQLFLVSIYPLFSIRSYFGNLRTYQGIWGMGWMQQEYGDNWNAIQWLLSNAPPGAVLVEADGESYTDANQISAFTGIPTVVGWAVHEWLWRGTYDIVAPRREQVKKLYEATTAKEVEEYIDQYHVVYIMVGPLERKKYPLLNEKVFDAVGTRVFTSRETTIWETRKR